MSEEIRCKDCNYKRTCDAGVENCEGFMPIQDSKTKEEKRIAEIKEYCKKIQLTANFNMWEFIESKHSKLIKMPTETIINRARAICILALQPARDALGSITIPSGHRPKKLNAKVGGVPDSEHITMEGCDAKFNACESFTALAWMVKHMPFVCIIWYPYEDRFHIGWRVGNRPRRILECKKDPKTGEKFYIPMKGYV